MQLKRYIITERATGRWIAAIYAEDFRPSGVRNSFTGSDGGHFWIGNTPIASVDDIQTFQVGDSGGRTEDWPEIRSALAAALSAW